MTLLLFVAGFALLIAGGELLVRGAVGAALRAGVSPLMIGLTLVGFGTSTPELLTSLQAALAGSPGIAVGNVVGSNIANILLILGVAALLSPVAADPRAFRRDGPALALATLALGALILVGQAGRPAGLVLIAGLVAYLVVTWMQERRRTPVTPTEAVEPPMPLWRALSYTVAGLVLVVLGARWLVSAAVTTAAALGVSETIIGLTIVAVGTSLPELVTSVVAALRRQGDIAFGNIVGSNIYNVLGILGVTALVAPVPIPPEIVRFDLWVVLAATAALIVFTRTGWRVERWEGAVLLAAYAAYVGWLALGAAGAAAAP